MTHEVHLESPVDYCCSTTAPVFPTPLHPRLSFVALSPARASRALALRLVPGRRVNGTPAPSPFKRRTRDAYNAYTHYVRWSLFSRPSRVIRVLIRSGPRQRPAATGTSVVRDAPAPNARNSYRRRTVFGPIERRRPVPITFYLRMGWNGRTTFSISDGSVARTCRHLVYMCLRTAGLTLQGAHGKEDFDY